MAFVDSFFVLLGGLGLFFYGMMQFSEALQSASSDFVKAILGRLTANRVMGVMVGTGITVLVQSSSISTAMTVGFVNAGLLTLHQAVSVIFGSNIGTTITGWIIAIKVSHLGVHMIGVGLFLSYFRKHRAISICGKVLFGLGLVFFGLETMSNVFKPLRSNETFIANLYLFSADTWMSLIGTVAMGCLLTIIVQSSSAMLGITIALASTGVISFQTSVALVMGENIGTTITAVLASVGGNTNAKRVALGHVLFNLSGTIVLILIFSQWVEFIEWVVPGVADQMLEDGAKPHIAQHIATSHTLFNLVCTLLFTPLLNPFVSLVIRIMPDPQYKEQTRLVAPRGVQIAPVIAIEEAYQELMRMSDVARRIVDFTRQMLNSNDKEPQIKERIHKYEDILDRMQAEILTFLNRVMEEHLTPPQTQRINAILVIAGDLENIGDYCRNIMKLRNRLYDEPECIREVDVKILQTMVADLCEIFALIQQEIAQPESIHAHHFDQMFSAYKQKGKRVRDEFLQRKVDGKQSATFDLNFADIITSLRKINGHCGSINRTLVQVFTV